MADITDETLETLARAGIIIDRFTEVIHICTAHMKNEMSAEVAMANIAAIIGKVNN